MQDKIISFLKSANNYVSGEEISRSLNMSRAAVWKHIEELRHHGYEIVAVPHLGYQLINVPDKLLAHEIQFHLDTKIFGGRVIHHDTVGSTMDEAFRLGMEGAPEGTVVCAEEQTKGRGRLGRSWISLKGKGIYLSIILRPKFSPTDVAKITLLCAVAVAEAVYKVSGVKASIKWPNDLLVENKKLAGILTELRAEVDRVQFIVVGIGVNVNNTSHQLIAGATSIKNETKEPCLRVALTREILRSLEQWYQRLHKEGFGPILKRWKECSVTLKKRVRVSDPGGTVEGLAIDLDSDGGLLIRQDSGVVVKKMAGDVMQ